MNIVFCTNNDNTEPVVVFLRKNGETVTVTDDHKSIKRCDLLMSYNYRHIIEPAILRKFPAINLHLSYLPWNRGSHPVMWAAINGTQMGVTIHWMADRLDGGQIIARMPVVCHDTYSLELAYQVHQDAMLELLRDQWQRIKSLIGDYHRTGDLKSVKLQNGWQTTIGEVRNANA